MLELTGVTKKFGKREVLHEINLSIDKGIIGLLGPNGAGKTTFLRILATVYEPTAGSIRLNGISWSKQAEEARKRIGYLPQHVGLFPALTSYEYLDYIAVLRSISSKKDRKQLIEQVLREVNLGDRAATRIRRLSGGMKQRLGIAQAIIHNPDLLLVDEPTAGLDPEERFRFRGLLRRLAEQRTVILSTHITEDVSMTCDRVCMIKQGFLEYFPSLSEVVKLASSKVWTMKIPNEQFYQLKEHKHVQIVHSSEADGMISLRMLADEKPYPEAVPAEPTLEEGYMTWLKA
ncbi:ATP-binding cassette domain-containing protein [Paenibacillus sp. N4]|uniref:ATP-binding cassette domain-containing protein n=1 Tax=Paenibacillus vietnamensis TaxID=2590547 RepID=UPI001CD07903|nr:ATP-binding cassette domain-containing protein [Paenibacillus vietnamensis]MCA0756136.1 ATP-binding cassette domain-containing protein [Paenibacillus vietnamensis]